MSDITTKNLIIIKNKSTKDVIWEVNLFTYYLQKTIKIKKIKPKLNTIIYNLN